MGPWVLAPSVPLVRALLAQAALGGADLGGLAALVTAATGSLIALGAGVRWLHGQATRSCDECLAREKATKAEHAAEVAAKDKLIEDLRAELRATDREALAATSRQLEAAMRQAESHAEERRLLLELLGAKGAG